MEEQNTALIDADLIPFVVDGEIFTIRQPSPEEYDDAMAIESITRKRVMALPEIAELKSLPCSDGELATWEAMIASAQALRDQTEDETAQAAIAERITRLQERMLNRTLADEVAFERASLARDRYLTQRLLCDKNGKQLLDPKAKNFPEKWTRLPLSVKNAARQPIWTALAMVQNVPFSWDLLRD
jgi:hypothetical protein